MVRREPGTTRQPGERYTCGLYQSRPIWTPKCGLAGWSRGCLVYTSLVQSAAVSARSDPHADLPRHLAGSQPKGEQLRRLLETLVAELGPGALLPSERMLAERYGVARMTVRKELDRLVAAGTAYRVQ